MPIPRRVSLVIAQVAEVGRLPRHPQLRNKATEVRHSTIFTLAGFAAPLLSRHLLADPWKVGHGLPGVCRLPMCREVPSLLAAGNWLLLRRHSPSISQCEKKVAAPLCTPASALSRHGNAADVKAGRNYYCGPDDQVVMTTCTPELITAQLKTVIRSENLILKTDGSSPTALCPA